MKYTARHNTMNKIKGFHKKAQVIIVAFLITATTLAQVSMGTITPEASALLDLTSTTQGLLPPRLTDEQRHNIASPIPAGLMIWCIDCGSRGELQVFDGTAWTNMKGDTVSAIRPPSIGDYRYGGVVFWIDPTDNSHGLVCAIEDQSLNIQWYNGLNALTDATGTAIGTGKTNTDLIINNQGPTETDYAAGLARAYQGGGYSDWFLPSSSELREMYLHRVNIDATAQDNGGTVFINGNRYWSSSEHSTNNALFLNFSNGNARGTAKNGELPIRAVRAF